jgi:TRAP-type C4-dicarboxylate transport system permease small subunit
VGDFELVEMGCAVAVAAFLPLCFMRKGNVIVDFVTAGLPSWITQCLDTLAALFFGLVAGFFAWRMCFGAKDMMYYNEETMLLQIPVWIPFMPVVFSFFVLSACCFYVAGRDARQLLLKG